MSCINLSLTQEFRKSRAERRCPRGGSGIQKAKGMCFYKIRLSNVLTSLVLSGKEKAFKSAST